ncbi:hypothetical protein V2J09_018006, partial [Rumex salicifolius]
FEPKLFGCTTFVHISINHKGENLTLKQFNAYSLATQQFKRAIRAMIQAPGSITSLWMSLSRKLSHFTPSNKRKEPAAVQHQEQSSLLEFDSQDYSPQGINPTLHPSNFTLTLRYQLLLENRPGSAPNNPYIPCPTMYPYIGSLPLINNSYNTLIQTPIPNTVSEALKHREWRDAMKEDMATLEKNQTWDLVDRQPGKTVVDYRWVFSLKYKADGTLERYKEHLVAKGYTQTYGIDYQNTFSPMEKMNTAKIIITLVAHFNWPLQQYDVNNALPNVTLEEEIYVRVPLGFDSSSSNKVCCLRKALHGLKQSPRAWFERFATVMTTARFKQSQGDHTLGFKYPHFLPNRFGRDA